MCIQYTLDILLRSRYTGYGQGRGLDGDTAVKGLIGANLAGWLLWQSNPGFMKRHFMVSYESVSNLRLHTLLTAAFSQFDGWHLFSNMFALYFFGRDIGRMLGGRKVMHPRCLLEMYAAVPVGIGLQRLCSLLILTTEIRKAMEKIDSVSFGVP